VLAAAAVDAAAALAAFAIAAAAVFVEPVPLISTFTPENHRR